MTLIQPNEVSNETRLKDLCEHTLCARCNATGGRPEFYYHASGVCFGCDGAGRKFSARGKVAKHYYEALLTTTADQIKVGDKISGGWLSTSKWYTVVEAERDTDNNRIMLRLETKKGSLPSLSFLDPTCQVKIQDKTTALARMRSTAALQASLKRNGEPK